MEIGRFIFLPVNFAAGIADSLWLLAETYIQQDRAAARMEHSEPSASALLAANMKNAVQDLPELYWRDCVLRVDRLVKPRLQMQRMTPFY